MGPHFQYHESHIGEECQKFCEDTRKCDAFVYKCKWTGTSYSSN